MIKMNKKMVAFVTLAMPIISFSQVSVPSNSGVAGDFVGWAAGNAFPLEIKHNANQPINFFTNNTPRALFAGGTGVNSGRFALGNNIPNTFTPLDRLHLHQDALSGVFMRFTYQGLANSAGTQLGIVGATGAGTSGDFRLTQFENTNIDFFTLNAAQSFVA
jgi:hypothetical protein